MSIRNWNFHGISLIAKETLASKSGKGKKKGGEKPAAKSKTKSTKSKKETKAKGKAKSQAKKVEPTSKTPRNPTPYGEAKKKFTEKFLYQTMVFYL